MTDVTLPSEEWWREYQDVVDADPAMTIHGREAFEEDFRVIAYDLPRHGKSVPPSSESWWADQYDLTAERFTNTIVSIADALELDEPVFIGSSMGGTVMLELAKSSTGFLDPHTIFSSQ